jgi:hypothetical protein
MAQNKYTAIITAKDETQSALDSVRNNFKRMDSGVKESFSKLDFVMKSFAVGLAVDVAKNVASFADSCIEQFRQIETSAILLKNAFGKNVFALEEYQEKIDQLNTVFRGTGDDLQAVAAKAASLGYDNATLDKLLETAVHLSNVFGEDINETFEQTKKIFEGSDKEIMKFAPELANLTDEQKKHGEALDFVLNKYKGLSEQLSGTAAQSVFKYKESIDDLKQSLGNSFAIAVKPFTDWLTGTIKNFTDAIDKANELKQAINEVNQKGEQADLQSRKRVLEEQLKQTQQARDIAKTQIGYDDKEWADRENGLRKQLQEVTQALKLNAEGAKYQSDVAKKLADANAQNAQALDKNANLLMRSNGEMADFISELTVSNQNASDVFGYFKNGLNTGLFSNITREDTERESALQYLRENNPEVFANDYSIFPQKMDAMSIVMDGFLSVLQSGASVFMEILTTTGPLPAIFAAVSTVVQGIFQVIGPAIDAILKPITGILVIIGRVIGQTMMPLLTALTPVIELIGKAFVFLYNYAIMPLSNAIIWIVSTIYNLVVAMVNAILNALDQIPFVDIGWRMSAINYDSMKLQAISDADLTAAGNSLNGGGSGYVGGSNGVGSMAGGHSITNNVYVTVETINGTTREAALMFLDEIKQAIALGLASY